MTRKAPPPFHRRFNLKFTHEAAQAHFVNRVLNFISGQYPTLEDASFPSRFEKDRNCKLRAIANSLGELYKQANVFSHYVRGDFLHCLQALEAIYKTLAQHEASQFSSHIQSIISESEMDLGIQWRNGTFFPSGAKLLDEALVDDNLRWLSDPKYRNVLAPFEKGLSYFLQAKKHPERLTDSITDMYEALEAMAKVVTRRPKADLPANRELFVKRLGLSDQYKEMLRCYISYGCEFRHALEEGKTRTPPPPQEVEAFIYTTGLFLRLAIESTTK